jgi:hypothetical protein
MTCTNRAARCYIAGRVDLMITPQCWHQFVTLPLASIDLPSFNYLVPYMCITSGIMHISGHLSLAGHTAQRAVKAALQPRQKVPSSGPVVCHFRNFSLSWYSQNAATTSALRIAPFRSGRTLRSLSYSCLRSVQAVGISSLIGKAQNRASSPSRTIYCNPNRQHLTFPALPSA